ncbi:MAG: VWA domain-containing protein [Candidatus Thiosymbion ectosymbiont of Robbea hypermnestra]|nr:VWA domain-containing protein [Candidatus Thiosymbion ectosymbiont of Robbea hypermnestra]
MFHPIRWLLIGCLLLLAAGADAGNHVRVVQDTSLSMKVRLNDGTGPNDPERLAVLATMLLYDLVDPNPRRPADRDSFAVLPFQPDWGEDASCPDTAPPTGIGTPIRATAQTRAARETFWRQLKELPYDGRCTYFYPGLRAAFDDLPPEDGGEEDRRVLVLVTDGVPESAAKESERQRLRELRNELLDKGVQLYVLAFGPTANRERAFFDAVFTGNDGRSLGELFIDPEGRDLVLNMAKIFSKSFGYMEDHIGTGSRRRDVDLDGDVTPPKVSVVSLRRGVGPAPSQTLEPAVNSRGVVTARSLGAAYSAQTIQGVDPNRQYRLISDMAGADVAILRQIKPELSLLPGFVELDGIRYPMKPGRVRRVVAETPFVLKVLAKSPDGTAGNQADLQLQHIRHGPRRSGCEYEWNGDPGSADQNSRQPFGGGMTMEIRNRFPADNKGPGAIYQGFIEVVAKYGNIEVGRLECADAHEVEVYPKLRITPHPSEAFLDPPTLAKDQRGCIEFTLETDDLNKLAVLGDEPYKVSAYLERPTESTVADALFEAEFVLDDEPVGYRHENTPWAGSLELTRSQLLDSHRLCVTLGTPRIDTPIDDLPLRLQMRLDHSPYDEFSAIAPFDAKLRVMPALAPIPEDFPWEAFWALLLPLLLGLLALLMLAPRRALPKDLGYALTALAGDAGDSPATAAAPPLQRLPPLTPLQRVPWPWPFNHPTRALQAPNSDRIVAKLKPLETRLFGIKPLGDLAVREIGGGPPEMKRRVAIIEVHRDYLLHGNTGRWRLTMGYVREQAPHRKSDRK